MAALFVIRNLIFSLMNHLQVTYVGTHVGLEVARVAELFLTFEERAQHWQLINFIALAQYIAR